MNTDTILNIAPIPMALKFSMSDGSEDARRQAVLERDPRSINVRTKPRKQDIAPTCGAVRTLCSTIGNGNRDLARACAANRVGDNSVPQGCEQEWQGKRLSLGRGAQEKIVENGKICRSECLTTWPSLRRFLWHDSAFQARAVFRPLCSSRDLPKHWLSAGQSR